MRAAQREGAKFAKQQQAATAAFQNRAARHTPRAARRHKRAPVGAEAHLLDDVAERHQVAHVDADRVPKRLGGRVLLFFVLLSQC